MPNSTRCDAARAQFDALTGTHFPLFLRRVLATSNPGAEYLHNWHIEAIGEYLAAAQRGEVTRLMINMPPRMLKSTIVSVAWPAWLLGHAPHSRIMAASYAQALAEKHSEDCRAIVRSQWYRRVFPQTMLAREQNSKTKFMTTARGYRLAVSVGGAAIGEGGNFLIVDDPINPLQARSISQRDSVNAWFEHSFATRLDDKRTGVIVLVMQRLHAEELSGYLLERGGWEHLCLPAIAPERTVIHIGTWAHARAAGSALQPAREPLALLEKTRAEIGSANFEAQYQQAPLAAAGEIIKPEWFARRFALKEILHAE